MNESYIFCGGLTPCIQRTLEFDALTVGQVNRAKKATETAAGKQLNVARLVQTLGGYVRTIGFCGGDNGRRLLAMLEAEGLFMESVPVDGNTRICQSLIDHAAKDVTELVEELPPVSDAEQQAFVDHFLKMRADASLITLSGTLPPTFPPDFYRTLLEGAQVPVIIDTHGPALLEALKVSPLMVKLNEHELAATFGSEGAQQLLDSGVEWVLVTLGADGAELFHKSGHWRYGTPNVNVLNPIGSGDAVTAGIAFAINQDRPMPEAVRFGLACGAVQTETLVAGVLDPARARAVENEVPFQRLA